MQGVTFNVDDANKSGYRVEHEDGCVLIAGIIPMGDLAILLQNQSAGSVLDATLARVMGVNFACGLPEDTSRLRDKYGPLYLEQVKNAYAREGLSESALRWLATGEQGYSSLVMMAFLTGVPSIKRGVPRVDAFPGDPDDLRRCRLLLEQVPDLQSRFETLRAFSPAWLKIIDLWPALCESMDRETPEWRTVGGLAPKTYALLQGEAVAEPDSEIEPH